MTNVYEDKWVKVKEWEEFAKTHKTRRFSVISKCSDCELGQIKYDTGWRRYIFEPIRWNNTIYSDRCKFSIGYFIFCKNRERGCKSDFSKKLIKILDEEFGNNWLNTAFQKKENKK